MKKSLKISLIVLGVLVGIIVLDTLQAKIFDNSPILKIRENLDGKSTDYIDKGLFVNYYHCNNNEKVTTWKGTKFACPIKDISNDESNISDEESNTIGLDCYVTKNDNKSITKFRDYYTYNDRKKIYLANNIEEFYIIDNDYKMTLKKFISTVYQTFDDSIKDITDKLGLTGALYDGSTKIYKSKEKDITLINCQKMNGNNNIYIGDYSLDLKENICN